MKKIFQEASAYLKGESIIGFETILQAGSERAYTRIITNAGSYILCRNENRKENETFFYFTEHFAKYNIPVPKVLAISNDKVEYLLSDNGKSSLLDILLQKGYTNEVMQYYKAALSNLAQMQIVAAKELDYSKCFTSASFGSKTVLADLNYFKYYFLDLQGIDYDKVKLLDEFNLLASLFDSTQYVHFMYRDFQGRNILIDKSDICFIDYQGGMNGPLQYDVASLLWQAKANLPQKWKEELLNHYLCELKSYTQIDEKQFVDEYEKIVMIRLLQVLGAYGLRGLIERKTHFITSITQGLANIEKWISQYSLAAYPTLEFVLRQLTNEKITKKYSSVKANEDTKLKVVVNSFSYKQGIPIDESGNGGGFVFDCRGILNPGRFEEYKKQTGRDKSVIEFLESNTRIKEFLEAAKQAVDISIEDYLSRNFENLSISFGCTGGQHRSVYSADSMAKHLKEKYNLDVVLRHRVQDAKNWIND